MLHTHEKIEVELPSKMSLLDEVKYNTRGNRLTMIKRAEPC